MCDVRRSIPESSTSHSMVCSLLQPLHC
uniref:Uncharacterized protein n=1 Tax=Nymphaea colorata TaxID=210225 RepID=A0A5K1F5I0_9MAGN|nr:unnamed protein product [Nymphaea colorata]